MAAAFQLVGVEKCFWGSVVENRSQFPREIGGVTDSRTHPLADERWHLVSRVARKEEPTISPPFGHDGMKPVGSSSHDLAGIIWDPRS